MAVVTAAERGSRGACSRGWASSSELDTASGDRAGRGMAVVTATDTEWARRGACSSWWAPSNELDTGTVDAAGSPNVTSVRGPM